MTHPDPVPHERVARGDDPQDLRSENERLRAELDRLQDDVARTLEEIAATRRRHREVLDEIGAVEASVAAIRASNTWRLIALGRGIRERVRAVRGRVAHRLGRRAGAGRRAVPERVRACEVGVNVSGYIAAESGLGEATRASIRALDQAGIPVALNDVPGVQRAADATYTSFVENNPHPFNLVHLNADNMDAFRRARGPGYFHERYTIGFWFWELSRFRDDWLAAFGAVNEVWAATRFARDAFASAAPASVPVVRMPLPVAAPIVPAGLGRAHFGIPADKFVFLFTFDVSSQMERKNPLALVRAFRQLDRADAVLVLKFTNGSFDREAVRRLREAGEGASVVMFDGTMDRPELNALMNSCDAYVSLHRSEGFGLTMAEAMALGKPVIATGYSGNMDFTTPDTASLVDFRLVPLTRNYGPYLAGFRWADPNIDQATRAMREMVEAPWRAAELGRRGCAAVETLLGAEAAARRYRARLEAIRRGLPPVDDIA